MIVPTDHIFWLLIVAIIMAGISIALAYMTRWESVLLSLVSLVCGYLSHFITLSPSAIWFWVVATVIVVVIDSLLPKAVRDSSVGTPYFVTGALAGTFIGMLLNSVAGIILGSAIGITLASIAFSRMRQGMVLGFPSRKFFNYLCAKGLPLVVMFSMLGILCLQLIVIGGTI